MTTTRFTLARVLRRAWGPVRPVLLVGLPLAAAAEALACAGLAWRDGNANRAIAALEAGQDRPVAADAVPELLLARIRFLAARDRLDEAEPLTAALDGGGAPALRALAQIALGNARLRQAFARLEAGDLERATPLVGLARQAYRRALTLRPEAWDAKFNLDVASRLVRDFPERGREQGEEMQADPKTIWTDIPGQPRGLP
ncbi:MxaK protein [Methylobacterium terricola]|uniref:MxaK protein n=1 Tax=Methylobacterium terricola TaxID=2583531 RepID=A0A5C4LJN8_9HYPH|nr:MxaK protein [Methylobacterium terricola]TNC14030.1 MxaK protein [Methylobacterium terricola]